MQVLLIMEATQEKVYTVIIEQDEDGVYIAKVPDITGCYAQGKTVAEATDRIREAIRACSNEEDTKPLRFVGIQQIQA